MTKFARICLTTFLSLATASACFEIRPPTVQSTLSTYTETIHPIQTIIITPSPILTPTLIITPTPYYPGLIVFPKIKTEYYDIQGSTRDELLDEMAIKGPIAGIDHEHSIAALEYDILYTWPGRGTAGCDVTKGEIWYSLKVYAPRWSPPSNAPAELIDAWVVFMDNVRAHEEGHIELVREYFKATLDAVTIAKSCSEAWDIADGLEKDLYRAQLKYDRDAEPTFFH